MSSTASRRRDVCLVYGTLSAKRSRSSAYAHAGRDHRALALEWVKQQGVFRMLSLFRQITSLMRAGVLTTPVAAIFTLDQLPEAIERASRSPAAADLLKVDAT